MNKKEKKNLMDALGIELISLKKSPLYKYRKENNYLPVVGEGDLSSKIMFIGEAPGRNEAKTGVPFCGAAGKILDELLSVTGLTREQVYITNIVKDRPPENRDPLPNEIKIYGPLLDRQIEIIKPKIIATLGRYSAKYILDKFNTEAEFTSIGKIHGKTFDTKASYGKIKILTLYHPCAAIYNRSKLPELKKDIKTITKLL